MYQVKTESRYGIKAFGFEFLSTKDLITIPRVVKDLLIPAPSF